MIILHDSRCAEYGSFMRPEQPARVLHSVAHLRTTHPEWKWHPPGEVAESALLAAHTPELIRRIAMPPDIDPRSAGPD